MSEFIEEYGAVLVSVLFCGILVGIFAALFQAVCCW